MIFNLFKSKPSLEELIPKGFIDIHSHILPGIDDGPESINKSLSLIQKMNDLGFKKIIATPHTYDGVYNNSKKSIEESFNRTISKLDIDINISYASEYMIDQSLIKKIENKSLLTLAENYVLIEMSYISPPKNLFEIIFELNTNNYIPVIAHPERYRFFFDDLKKYYKLKKFGCKFQLNLLSVVGYYGKDVSKISDLLLSKEIIDFVGSDIHNQNHINAFKNHMKIRNIDKLEKAINNNLIFI